MKILWTDANDDQIQKDYPDLLQAHKQALREELTWDIFGGVITINGHRYQVMEGK